MIFVILNKIKKETHHFGVFSNDVSDFFVYFDDVNSDGESDVILPFHHDDYTFTQLVWCWDNNGYVYREELSCLRDEPIWVNEME